MKLLKRFVSFTIWGVILVNLILMGFFHIPASQHFIGEKVADAIGHKLGTDVSIGRVDMGFLNRIIIDDVKIYDQQKKIMLSMGRLSAKIDFGPLRDGKISISSAQLFGAHFNLYRQNAQAPYNFQFALDSLASKDTLNHTPLDLRINSLIIRRTSVRYNQFDRPVTDGTFNTSHLYLMDVSANISLKALTDDSLNLHVKRLGCFEESGLSIDHVSFKLAAGKRHAQLAQLVVQMPSSTLKIDTLKADYEFSKNGLDLSTFQLSTAISQSSITPSDLRCFMPPLKNFQRSIDVQTILRIKDNNLSIDNLQLSTKEKDIDIAANGWIGRLSGQPTWHLQMNKIILAENSLDFLSKTIPQIPKEVARIGNLSLTGSFDRNMEGTLSLKSIIQSGAGSIDIQGNILRDKTFHADLVTEDINMRQLLADDHFGTLSAKVNISGQLHDKRTPDLSVNGIVEQFDYKDYSYTNLTLNGSYQQETVSGTFNIEDPNVNAHLEGELTQGLFEGTSTKAQKVKLIGRINRLIPAILKLTDQLGNGVISADIDADFTARTLNDAIGSIHISNFDISGDEQKRAYHLDDLTFTTGYDQDVHYLSLKSDFADAILKGHYDYGTLQQSFTNVIAAKLPTLPGLPAVHKTDNDFNLHLILSKTDWIQRFFNIDIQLSHPLTLEASINDPTEALDMKGRLPAFAYNGSWYADGRLDVTSVTDSMKCDLRVTKLMETGHDQHIQLLAGASNNQLTSSIRWDNQDAEKRMSGELNTIIQLYRNALYKSEAHIRVMPSHIILNNSTWNVEPSDILYHENHLLIDNFAVHHGQQHIIVDGIASKQVTDTLTADLNEVEVGYILDLVNFHSVEFSGKATGRAYATSIFDKFAASADLQVDEFKFEEGRMGTLYAKAQWNQEEEQIDIQAHTDDGPEAKTVINGYVSPVHNTIDLAIDAHGTYIDFMHNFTKSFISQISGHADGGVRLAGTLDNINLTGQLVVDGVATVSTLNTTYKLQKDTVVMIPDEIELRHLTLTDKEGNKGILSGGIHHKHLTSLTYDLFVDTDNLLAYDFRDFGESSFYGTVYATGRVGIHGRPHEVTIDCDVTPNKNSVFVYNAANPNAISKQEFIEWDSSDDSTTTGKRHKNQIASRAADTDIYINFLLNVTPDATLRLLMDANTKDYISLNGDGAIRATFHNKGPFNMFGTYTVDHGTYGITIQNIIKKNFTFNQGGTIVFGGDPYNAALNLQAVNTINGVSLSDLNIGNSFTNNTIRVNCLMNISGQPNAPQVDFDLEMPNVNADEQQMVRSVINGQQEMNQQVVYLLAIGRFYNQGVNNANDQQTDRTSLAMQSFLSGTLSTQINTLLSQIIKNDNWNFGANISTGNEGWHNAEYEGIINGRMLNNRLLFNGQFGYRDNATRANPSFIGDFDVQYLLFPNGNLALKVYNQTNDRYFTKSSLNTQGIGLIMKKDFNTFGDLFGRKKKQKK